MGSDVVRQVAAAAAAPGERTTSRLEEKATSRIIIHSHSRHESIHREIF